MREIAFVLVLATACNTTAKETVEEVCVDASTDGHEVLYQGQAYYDMDGDSLVLTNEEDWMSFQESLILPTTTDTLLRTEMDWTEEQIVVASTHVASTCGLYTQVASSCTKDDISVLQLVVDDFSGSCENVCEASDQVLLIVVITSTLFWALPAFSVSIQHLSLPSMLYGTLR